MLQFQVEEGAQERRQRRTRGLEEEWESQGAQKGERKVERTGYGRYIYKRRSQNMLKIDQIEIYEGIWDKNCLDGFGRQIDSKGNMYIGEFKNGTRQNDGLYFFANGDRYHGEWSNNKFHGIGTYYYSKSDETCLCKWNNGHAIDNNKMQILNSQGQVE